MYISVCTCTDRCTYTIMYWAYGMCVISVLHKKPKHHRKRDGIKKHELLHN